MSKVGMLGAAEVKGPFSDLMDKLGGSNGGEWLVALKHFLRKENPWEDPIFQHDMRKSGWKLLNHTSRRIQNISDVRLISFLYRGEYQISRRGMLRRACVELNANFGQDDGEYLLEHQDEIPAEYREFYILLPGTVWLSVDGDCEMRHIWIDSCCRCHVPFLWWQDGSWCMDFQWLALGFHPNERLLCFRK